MALQNLTPQLRTRLSRLERVVGWFVAVAIVFLAGGLTYYVYQVAQRKGWFLEKMPYFTFVRTGTGLKVGDKVKLMGFEAGEITEITPMPPEDFERNIYVAFRVKEPYYGYLWEDSQAKVAVGDFLGNRYIEITKGTNSAPTYLLREIKELPRREVKILADSPHYLFGQEVYDKTGSTSSSVLIRTFEPLTQAALLKIPDDYTNTLQIFDQRVTTRHPKWVWNDKAGRYRPFINGEKGYWLHVAESPAVTERLEAVLNLVETAMPNILDLTNKISRALTQAANAAARADELLTTAQPVVTNLALITRNIANPKGSLGEWLIPTNVNRQLTQTLASANIILTNANVAVTNTDARLALLVSNLNRSLENMTDITSNLNAQVQANSNIVSSLSKAIVNSDEFIQGLKRHWLLRSAFKAKATNSSARPMLPPKSGSRP